LAFWPGYRPVILVSGVIACRTARSTRQKIRNARQITVIRASMRRLVLRNIGATASGPVNAE
jgi:hypothetical protein